MVGTTGWQDRRPVPYGWKDRWLELSNWWDGWLGPSFFSSLCLARKEGQDSTLAQCSGDL